MQINQFYFWVAAFEKNKHQKIFAASGTHDVVKTLCLKGDPRSQYSNGFFEFHYGLLITYH